MGNYRRIHYSDNTLNPNLGCNHCQHHWFPRGGSISSKCPNCGRDELIYYTREETWFGYFTGWDFRAPDWVYPERAKAFFAELRAEEQAREEAEAEKQRIIDEANTPGTLRYKMRVSQEQARRERQWAHADKLWDEARAERAAMPQNQRHTGKRMYRGRPY
jgi:predicted  nucleic acid-binding Zn-ribbon protein